MHSCMTHPISPVPSNHRDTMFRCTAGNDINHQNLISSFNSVSTEAKKHNSKYDNGLVLHRLITLLLFHCPAHEVLK